MHIVYISREYPPAQRMGGIAAYLKEITVAMVNRGHKVTVIAANDDTRCEIRENIDGVDVIRLKGGDFIIPGVESSMTGLKKFRTIYRFKSYRKKIRKAILSLNAVDVIEIGEYGAEGYFLKDLAIPVTMRLHTPTLLNRETGGLKKFSPTWFHEYWVGRKELKLMPKFRNVTSCSKSLLDWCQKYIPEFTAHGRVIYNPLDMSSWQQSKDLKYVENTVFYAGTVAETKGVGDLVKAVAILNENGHHVKLKIAGKIGSYGKTLKDYCQGMGYDWCEFLGHISRQELKKYYTESKVSCFPSWWENLPMVCLEAMAIGNIVIGSENGGMSEIITDSVDGFLIKPMNAEHLSKTIEKALSLSTSEVSDLRIMANRKIKTMFSTNIIAEDIENYYESICI